MVMQETQHATVTARIVDRGPHLSTISPGTAHVGLPFAIPGERASNEPNLIGLYALQHPTARQVAVERSTAPSDHLYVPVPIGTPSGPKSLTGTISHLSVQEVLALHSPPISRRERRAAGFGPNDYLSINGPSMWPVWWSLDRIDHHRFVRECSNDGALEIRCGTDEEIAAYRQILEDNEVRRCLHVLAAAQEARKQRQVMEKARPIIRQLLLEQGVNPDFLGHPGATV